MSSQQAEQLSPINIDVRLHDGRTERFAASDIWFANYPEHAWTGTYAYSAYPFQWWRNKQIEIDELEGLVSKINIDKISGIKVVGQYSGKLTFKSIAANELTGNHVRENLNSDSRKGPSDWDIEKEGVLIQVNKDLFVFIPFVVVDQIELHRSSVED